MEQKQGSNTLTVTGDHNVVVLNSPNAVVTVNWILPQNRSVAAGNVSADESTVQERKTDESFSPQSPFAHLPDPHAVPRSAQVPDGSAAAPNPYWQFDPALWSKPWIAFVDTSIASSGPFSQSKLVTYCPTKTVCTELNGIDLSLIEGVQALDCNLPYRYLRTAWEQYYYAVYAGRDIHHKHPILAKASNLRVFPALQEFEQLLSQDSDDYRDCCKLVEANWLAHFLPPDASGRRECVFLTDNRQFLRRACKEEATAALCAALRIPKLMPLLTHLEFANTRLMQHFVDRAEAAERSLAAIYRIVVKE